jgi:outer membrane protein OmpA-like peptidoglycan-associated protein
MGYASALTTAPRQAMAAPVRSLRTKTPSPAPCGNQAHLRHLQTKLRVGSVNDPLEHEADRVADQVIRMPTSSAAITSAPPQVSRKCAACAEEEKLQKKEAGTQATAGGAPASVHETLRSPGQPLDAAARAYFEPRFGRDFSGVRVHADASAAQSAREVNAHAYSVGHDIAFDSGRFAPGSPDGRQLIAHELTHVVQQGETGAVVQRQDASKPTELTLEIGDVCVLYEKGEEAKSHTAKGILDLDVGFEGFISATYPEFYGTGSPDAVAIADFEVDSGALRSSTKSTLQASWVPTYKPGETLEFLGYSDCVGPEGNNVSLREKRAKAVADLFPSATRIIRGAPIHEYVADGTSPAGRALNRSVVIRRPEPPPPVHKDPEPKKHEAPIKMEEPPTKDCSTDQRKQLSIAYPAAKLMAERALAALSKRDSVVDFLLERYFGPDALKHVPEIRAGFSKILSEWKNWDPSFECQVQTEKGCSNDDPHKVTLAHVKKERHIFSPNQAYGGVYVCEEAFSTPENMQIISHVILHELSHRLDNTDDHKYCWEDEGYCPSLDTKEAIDNADSYAGFAQDYFNATL